MSCVAFVFNSDCYANLTPEFENIVKFLYYNIFYYLVLEDLIKHGIERPVHLIYYLNSGV